MYWFVCYSLVWFIVLLLFVGCHKSESQYPVSRVKWCKYISKLYWNYKPIKTELAIVNTAVCLFVRASVLSAQLYVCVCKSHCVVSTVVCVCVCALHNVNQLYSVVLQIIKVPVSQRPDNGDSLRTFNFTLSSIPTDPNGSFECFKQSTRWVINQLPLYTGLYILSVFMTS